MKAEVKWTSQMQFEGVVGKHTVKMDSKPPVGKDEGMTPKELVALGIGGCTAMDVIALMRKHKQTVELFRVEVETSATSQHPVVFSEVQLVFHVFGAIEESILREAIELSQTKYCGVSAMISKTAKIQYRAILNGTEIGGGVAHFEL